MKKISHKSFRNTLANIFSVSLIVMLVAFIVFLTLTIYEGRYTDHFSSQYGPTPANLAVAINIFLIVTLAAMIVCGITKWVDRLVMKALKEARR